MDTASNMIYEAAHPDVNLIWGASFDDSLEDEMIVTVIATGFESVVDYSLPKYQFKTPVAGESARLPQLQPLPKSLWPKNRAGGKEGRGRPGLYRHYGALQQQTLRGKPGGGRLAAP
jgi:hypothetical protein